MEGVLTYADIFAKWIENLEFFWGIMTGTVVDLLNAASSTLIAGTPLGIQFKTIITLLTNALNAFGLGQLSVLTFILSTMGFAFGVYFLWVLASFIIDLLP